MNQLQLQLSVKSDHTLWSSSTWQPTATKPLQQQASISFFPLPIGAIPRGDKKQLSSCLTPLRVQDRPRVRFRQPTEDHKAWSLALKTESIMKKAASHNKRDIYQDITDQIIAAIEAGAGKASLPWHRKGAMHSLPANAITHRPYNGINVFLLWCTAEAEGYLTNEWATYRQWQDAGAQVKKGEKSTTVIFYKEYSTGETDEDGEEEKRRVARAFRVFNAAQVDGYESPTLSLPENIIPITQHEEAEALVANTGANIRHGGQNAFYRPSEDFIQMPLKELFKGTGTISGTEGYYATLLHELTHWSGHGSRMNRDLNNRFGDDAYAMEELVAELGASFLCAELGVTPTLRSDHIQYIAHWLEVMKGDKKSIFTAAAQASQAVQFLTNQHTKAVAA